MDRLKFILITNKKRVLYISEDMKSGSMYSLESFDPYSNNANSTGGGNSGGGNRRAVIPIRELDFESRIMLHAKLPKKKSTIHDQLRKNDFIIDLNEYKSSQLGLQSNNATYANSANSYNNNNKSLKTCFTNYNDDSSVNIDLDDRASYSTAKNESFRRKDSHASLQKQISQPVTSSARHTSIPNLNYKNLLEILANKTNKSEKNKPKKSIVSLANVTINIDESYLSESNSHPVFSNDHHNNNEKNNDKSYKARVNHLTTTNHFKPLEYVVKHDSDKLITLTETPNGMYEDPWSSNNNHLGASPTSSTYHLGAANMMSSEQQAASSYDNESQYLSRDRANMSEQFNNPGAKAEMQARQDCRRRQGQGK